jgi:hypothetical protein
MCTYFFNPDSPWKESLRIILNSDKKASDEDINNRVFRKNNQIYYYDEVSTKYLSSN